MTGNLCQRRNCVEKVNKLVTNDRRLSACLIAESVCISTSRVHSILTENLLMMKVSARWVPWMLSDAYKANWFDTSTRLLCLLNANPDNSISLFLTMDKTWLHHFDPESKMRSMAWKHLSSSPPRKLCIAASAHTVMATVFWDAEGIVLINYLVLGSTITGIYYNDLISKARAALKEKRRGKLHTASRGAVLPGQRTCSHVISSTSCHPKCWIQLLPHPLYSPGLARSDFYLFPKLKEFMKGWNFADDEDVICMAHAWPGRPRSTILLQRSPSFGETLDQVHFSWRRLCWKVWQNTMFISYGKLCQATNFLNAPSPHTSITRTCRLHQKCYYQSI